MPAPDEMPKVGGIGFITANNHVDGKGTKCTDARGFFDNVVLEEKQDDDEIPEFSTIVIPVVLLLLMVAVMRKKKRS